MPSDTSPRRTVVRHRTDVDRLLVVFSDIEMGGGGPYDDFPNSRFLGELILSYLDPKYDRLAIDLVFNGDTFDLLKTAYAGAYPHHVTKDVALGKMTQVAGAHPAFFEALRTFLARADRRGNVYFVVGNHDAELLFPAVQRLIRTLCEDDDRVHFPGFGLDIGRVHIEHGSQIDPLFKMDEARPFVVRGDEQLLNLSWASVALLDVAIPLQPLLYHHDRLKPKKLVLDLMPEIKELMLSAFWSYWTKDYWRDFFSNANPVKTVSWTMLKELVRRMVSRDPDVAMSDEFQRRIVDDDRFDLYLVGHQHEPGWWSYGRRKVMRTGAMRDEFMLSPDGEAQVPINKTYAEVFMSGEEVARSHLVEIPSPPRPPGTMPESIFDVLPGVRARLAPADTRSRQQVEQNVQEARETGREPEAL